MAIKNIDIVEEKLGLEKGKFQEYLTSEEEHEINVDNLVIFSKDDYNARIDNIKKETSIASVEMAVKKYRNELGLEFQGKTMDNLLNNFKEKIESESKIEPEERYTKLKGDFEKLQGVSQGFQDKYTDLENKIKSEKQQSSINQTLLKSIPDNTSIPKEDVLAILKAKNNFNMGEDGFEIIKDGKVLKNETTMNNLSADEFMKSFIKPYLKPVEGGAGNDDSVGEGKEGSFEAFDKEMERKGVSQQEYSLEMAKRIKEGTLKI